MSGCTKSANSSETVCPFSQATWEQSEATLSSLEGGEPKTYDSLYYGLTYSYPKEYNGLNGTIKYMYDDKGTLKSIGWLYSCDNVEDLSKVYNMIYEPLKEQYGDFNYVAPGLSDAKNSGGVWYRDEGNIVLSTMTTDEVIAVQCAYLHPDVSRGGREE